MGKGNPVGRSLLQTAQDFTTHACVGLLYALTCANFTDPLQNRACDIVRPFRRPEEMP
jgi:hypothetical protein